MKMSHDLFGQIAVPAHDSIEAGLVRKDEATRQERASRWQFLEDVRDGGEITYIGRIEGAYLFREAELAFVDGHFAATVVLAHAVIEWMLQGWLMDQERFAEARMGMSRLLRFAEESGVYWMPMWYERSTNCGGSAITFLTSRPMMRTCSWERV